MVSLFYYWELKDKFSLDYASMATSLANQTGGESGESFFFSKESGESFSAQRSRTHLICKMTRGVTA